MIKHTIGIDLGGTNIKAALVSEKGEIIKVIAQPTEAQSGAVKVIENIKKVIADIIRYAERGFIIIGIGVGTPGFVNDYGVIIGGANNIPGWNGTDIKTLLEKEFGLMTKIENDVTALTLGEALFGSGSGYKNIICLALGTGLGGGIIIDGKLYRGSQGCAGEFGHIVVQPDGFDCTCGRKGCLEAYASAIGIDNIANQMMKKNESIKIKDTRPITIYSLAKQGNRIAKKIVQEVGNYLGIGIGSLVNIFDPDVVIIGGGISKSGKILFDSIYPSLYKHCLKFYEGKIKLLPTKFQDYSGVVGAASLILKDF